MEGLICFLGSRGSRMGLRMGFEFSDHFLIDTEKAAM